jgi:hypothetical protein
MWVTEGQWPCDVLWRQYEIVSIVSKQNMSEMTLNYWMMVERYPNIKEEVGGSIPDCENLLST